jgi:Cof subfamily protein (haloacid dehalogenase superfamily)
LDVDGTLVNKQGQIGEPDRLAVRQAQDAGVMVVICTGRVIGACRSVLESLALKGPNIFFDGAVVYDISLAQPVYEQPISPEVVKRACELALLDDIPLDLFTFSGYFVSRLSWRTELRRRLFGLEATVADFNTLWQRERIIRGGIVLNTPEDENRVRAYGLTMRADFTLSWSTIPGCPGHHFINVLSQGVSKGRALQALAAYLAIPLSEVMAIGDGVNDISLLETAGLAIAMENAPASLKSLAAYITPDVENCGVAEAIRRFLV